MLASGTRSEESRKSQVRPKKLAKSNISIGNGPSALILSFILSGNRPYYSGGHDDRILDRALSQSSDLLHVAPEAYAHLQHDLKYSTQALPINVLLDTLIRPHGDVGLDDKTCVEWRYEPEKAVRHLVLGNAPYPGGQWQDNPVKASWNIGSLSYGEQLSLPGYSFAEHWQSSTGEPVLDFSRPTRAEYAEYLRHYPTAVDISRHIRSDCNVTKATRFSGGFHIAPYNISCRNLVLATGVFSIRIPPPRFLGPLGTLAHNNRSDGAILVIGSGFTAADIIISSPPGRKIVHLFKWDPVNRPSPLKGCHGSAYPEYAWIYRQMKMAAEKKSFSTNASGPTNTSTRRPSYGRTPTSTTPSFSQRNWLTGYEGFANARIISMTGDDHTSPVSSSDEDEVDPFPHSSPQPQEEYRNSATITIGRSAFGHNINRTITSFHYAVGRRSTLSYLSQRLQAEVLSPVMTSQHAHPTPVPEQFDCILPKHKDFAAAVPSPFISGQSLRGKIEEQAAGPDARAAGLQLAPGVWAIGSLTGDSLVRFAHGGCCAVAGGIEDSLKDAKERDERDGREEESEFDSSLAKDWAVLEKDWWIWA